MLSLSPGSVSSILTILNHHNSNFNCLKFINAWNINMTSISSISICSVLLTAALIKSDCQWEGEEGRK